MNKLYYGDNLQIMRNMPKGCVDLIYLDPPFNSKRNYNLMYKTMTGKPVPEQVEAFCDTWEMDADKERRAKEMPVLMREYGVDDYYVEFWRLWMQALRNTQPHLLAYLIYMVERLLHMKIILKPTGSIYLHCDPTASHYIKVMMDGIFGHVNFRNEIIWHYEKWSAKSNKFQKNHDVILVFGKTNKTKFNNLKILTDNLKKKYEKGYLIGGGGGSKGLVVYNKDLQKVKEMIESKKYKVHYSSMDGRSMSDVWSIPIINPMSKERLGYPTQKPIALLDRIIEASTDKGDVVFDPFCGCGTTIYSAHKNNRKWIGCDIAILAIKLIRHTLEERYRLSEGDHFEVDGIPASVEQAMELFKRDPFQFEHWIVERVGAFPTKKTGDKGIDGRMYFETKEGLVDMVLSVKGGTIRPADIRDLRGVLEREKNAQIAGFISMKKPTKAMREEAATSGVYEYSSITYNRIQLLTIEEILVGKKCFHTPSVVGIKEATGQMSMGYDY